MESGLLIIVVDFALFVEMIVVGASWVAPFLIPVAHKGFGFELRVEVGSLPHDEVSVHPQLQNYLYL